MENENTARIVRGVLSLGRRLRAERPQGSSSLSAIGLLGTLHRLGTMPAVRLAAEERLQPQSLSRLIAALERDGLIARTPGEADRRELLISLTDRGREALAADMAARRRWLDQAMAATLTEVERAVLQQAATVMQKLADYDGD